ncbi:MAG TPA: hypothetical protein VHG08_24190 [Longimicrobium sp.]|nr:hypothetical protein [Longimicrobium sp.]
MKRFRWMRNTAVGAAFGTALAICLHIWQVYATTRSGIAPEGVAFNTYLIAQLLGFPTNMLLSTVVDLPGWSGYLLLLLGIVVNWALLFLLVGLVRSRRE